jgi:hypothetical protein
MNDIFPLKRRYREEWVASETDFSLTCPQARYTGLPRTCLSPSAGAQLRFAQLKTDSSSSCPPVTPVGSMRRKAIGSYSSDWRDQIRAGHWIKAIRTAGKFGLVRDSHVLPMAHRLPVQKWPIRRELSLQSPQRQEKKHLAAKRSA